MYAVKTMTLEMAELTRRCEAARGFLAQSNPPRRPRLPHGLLLALGVAGTSVAMLIGLLFASAILDF